MTLQQMQTRSRPSSQPRLLRTRRAFSLIELIVVVSIIAVLASLLLGIGPAIIEKSEVNRTKDILRIADMAITEWINNSGTSEVTWGTQAEEDGLPVSSTFQFDIQWDDGEIVTPDFQLYSMLTMMLKNDACKEILSKIDEEYLHEGYDEEDPPNFLGWELLDAWGNRIYLIHPGRTPRTDAPFNDDADPDVLDADGTVYVNTDYAAADGAFEERYGVCKNRQILLVSAGPDGEFGDPLHADQLPRKHATDNVFSYEPIQPYQP